MRILIAGGALLASALAGCSTIDVVSKAPVLSDSLIITPDVRMMCLGDTAVLRAALASDGIRMPVRWSSDSTRVVTVDDSGVARTRGVGTTTIRATALGGSHLQASTADIVPPDAMEANTFTSIVVSGTSTAVDLRSAHGAIDVVSPVPGHAGCLLNPSYDRAELHLADASGGHDTVVAVNTAAPIVPGTTVRFTFDTDARLANGAPAFPNGTYMLSARLLSVPLPRRNVAIVAAPITIANP